MAIVKGAGLVMKAIIEVRFNSVIWILNMHCLFQNCNLNVVSTIPDVNVTLASPLF